MNRVMVFGTFDILHPGHLYFFTRAKKYGDLYVVIARDSTVKEIKGYYPLNNESERKKNVENLRIAHKVMLGNLGDKFDVIEEVNPDVICIGYDQKSFVSQLPEELAKRRINCEVIRLGPYKPEKYKASKFKRSTKINTSSNK